MFFCIGLHRYKKEMKLDDHFSEYYTNKSEPYVLFSRIVGI